MQKQKGYTGKRVIDLEQSFAICSLELHLKHVKQGRERNQRDSMQKSKKKVLVVLVPSKSEAVGNLFKGSDLLDSGVRM